jgi:hypothetical protein
MKGIKGPMGEMKIPLRPDARPIKQRPYRLNPKYKQKVKIELDRMLEAGIIEPVEESEWISPMVVQDKKSGEIRICVDLRKLNDACLHDPFPTPFTDEVLDNVGGQEVYSFTDGFSGYHQIPPTSVRQLHTALGHTRYYRKFIKGYAQITTPMEKLLKKDSKFQWTKECQQSFDTLKQKMVTVPILVFLDWSKEFNVHVNASSIALGVVLAQLGAGDIDHPIAFASRNLSTAERNYTTTKREGLAMVYVLQKFRHYL